MDLYDLGPKIETFLLRLALPIAENVKHHNQLYNQHSQVKEWPEVWLIIFSMGNLLATLQNLIAGRFGNVSELISKVMTYTHFTLSQ